MKIPTVQEALRGVVLTFAVTALSIQVARAHPYASGITNNGGTISFILNESADTVGVSFPQNNSTNFLGANLAAGPHSFTLGSGTNQYRIYVRKTGVGHMTQISDDSNTLNQFPSPRGVAVNNNPNNHNFGRIYICNASGSSGVTRGLYVRNANQSEALGYGGTAKAPGLTFQASSYSPFRCYVGPDDTLFVGSATTLTSGGFLGYMNPDMTSGGLALTGAYSDYDPSQNHTLIIGTPAATGSLAGGDLKIRCMDALYQTAPASGLSILEWDINGGPYPSSVTPTVLGVSGLGAFQTVSDSISLGNGTNYLLLSRSSPTDGAKCVQIFSPGDNINRVWDSLSTSPVPGVDLLNQIVGMTISPDGQIMALARGLDSGVTLMYVTNGIPDWGTIFTNIPPTTAGSTYGSVCFDSAENLYIVTSGSSVLRVYSLGLSTTCITANDASTANGTFQLIIPASTVSVAATTPAASQNNGSPIPGVFTITRAGLTTQPLTVHYSFGGTAVSGANYTISPASAAGGNITFPPNVTSTNITITPTPGGSLPTLSVVLTIGGGSDYTPVLPGNATVTIANTGPQLVFVSGAVAPSMYLALSNDFASFTLTRWGDTNVTTTPSPGSFVYAGSSATVGTDFTAPVPVAFNPGDVNQTVTISPLLNGVVPSHSSHPYVGNKKVVIAYSGANASSNAVLTFIDDANPPAPVLWQDPLTNNLAGGNPPTGDGTSDGYAQWHVTYANKDMGASPGPDYDVQFGYWLDPVNNPNDSNGANGEIPLPPSRATNVLRVTCNKSLGITAGVNVYPTNVTFSGNYAVRFNMNFVQDGNTGVDTEGPLFGINHYGIYTNWWSGDGVVSRPNNDANFNWACDGFFCWLDGDRGGTVDGDFTLFTGIADPAVNLAGDTGWKFLRILFSAGFVNNFKVPAPYTGLPDTSADNQGIPANASPVNGYSANTWSDVEIKQLNNVISVYINKTLIFSTNNTQSYFRSGTLMLGWNDPFASPGTPDGAAYFSNLQVVRIGAPQITGITVSGQNCPTPGTATITFTATDGTASFAVQRASVVTGPYTDVSPAATIITLAPGVFQATTPAPCGQSYYRIREQ